MTTQTLSPRKASIALRKAGLSVVSCRDGGVRGMDVLCDESTDRVAVMEVLREQGWTDVRTLGGDFVFASYPVKAAG